MSIVTFLPSHQHVYDWAPAPHPQQEGNEKDRTKGIGASPTTGPRQDGHRWPWTWNFWNKKSSRDPDIWQDDDNFQRAVAFSSNVLMQFVSNMSNGIAKFISRVNGCYSTTFPCCACDSHYLNAKKVLLKHSEGSRTEKTSGAYFNFPNWSLNIVIAVELHQGRPQTV